GEKRQRFLAEAARRPERVAAFEADAVPAIAIGKLLEGDAFQLAAALPKPPHGRGIARGARCDQLFRVVLAEAFHLAEAQAQRLTAFAIGLQRVLPETRG